MSYGYIIYCATNILNNKKYIGSTSDLERRKKEHFNNSKREKYSKIIFYSALQKYGFENFKWEILYTGYKPFISKFLEEQYIRRYNTHYKDGYGYNMQYVSSNYIEGKKISESLKEYHKSNPHLLGKLMSESAKIKLSNIHKGKKISEEQKRKISEGWKNSNKDHRKVDSKIITIEKINIPSTTLFSKEYANMMSKIKKGKTLFTYEIIEPNGSVLIIENIVDYAKNNNLCKNKLYGLSTGRIKKYRGYKVKKLFKNIWSSK